MSERIVWGRVEGSDRSWECKTESLASWFYSLKKFQEGTISIRKYYERREVVIEEEKSSILKAPIIARRRWRRGADETRLGQYGGKLRGGCGEARHIA